MGVLSHRDQVTAVLLSAHSDTFDLTFTPVTAAVCSSVVPDEKCAHSHHILISPQTFLSVRELILMQNKLGDISEGRFFV